MPHWTFSTRSLARLDGVHDDLVKVTHRALEISSQDFGVICGRRTIEEQRRLVETGRSHTLNSKHVFDPALAIDVLAYNGADGSWNPADYFPIADAFCEASYELKESICWGGCWRVLANNLSAREMNANYEAQCRAENRRPFNDLGHFELTRWS